VNSAGTGGIEPKNFERDGPKFSSARTEISENPQIITQQISKKIYFLLKKKIRGTEFPIHAVYALHGISGAWHVRPAIDFSDPPGPCQRGKPGVRRTAAVFWIDTKLSTKF
jgi:hypothetical protein